MNLKHTIKKTCHPDAVNSADLVFKVMSGKQPPVHQQTNIALANRVAANKKDRFLWLRLFCLMGGKLLLSEGTTIASKS